MSESFTKQPREFGPRGFDLGRCFLGLPSCVHLVQGVAPLTSHSERYTFCIAMRFEWDREKNWINQQKHGGIAFESAALVFDDPHVIFRKDRIVTGEQRWHAIGAAEAAVLLVARISYGE